jgi:hypothetical protein
MRDANRLVGGRTGKADPALLFAGLTRSMIVLLMRYIGLSNFQKFSVLPVYPL